MTKSERNRLIAIIEEREKLRAMSRWGRLWRAPIRTIPYYLLAAISHLKPFKISFATLWGTKMCSYLPEGNTFLYYGFCEANLTNFFLRYLAEGMTLVDVGAHVGIYTMLSSGLVGPTGKVHSFEPTPRTFSLLQTNVSGLENVLVHNLALSKHNTTISFRDYGAGYSAYNSAHTKGANLSISPTIIEVESVALDGYLVHNQTTPDVIKIDAEGFESDILRGAPETISPANINRPLIILEVANGETWADNRSAAFSILQAANYQPYQIATSGKLLPHTIQNDYQYDNLVFVPNEKLESIVQLLT